MGHVKISIPIVLTEGEKAMAVAIEGPEVMEEGSFGCDQDVASRPQHCRNSILVVFLDYRVSISRV
jgi:hypothetical protein